MTEEKQELVCLQCGFDDCVCEGVSCWKCGGQGYVIICVDDMCHGAGQCMHGDGEMDCSECEGEGELYPRKGTFEEYKKLRSDV